METIRGIAEIPTIRNNFKILLKLKTMEIKIQSLHFKANDLLEKFVQNKVGKLSHFNDRIVSGDVCLKLDKSQKLDNKVCEIRLSIPGNDLFAKRQSNTFEEATNEVVEALQKQLRRNKTQLQNKRHSK